MSQYTDRKAAGKVNMFFWFEPEEAERLRALAESRGTSLRAAVAYAVARALAAEPSGDRVCKGCGSTNPRDAEACATCGRKVQIPRGV